MVYPAVKLNQLYSLNFYEGFDVIFENLDMMNMANLLKAIKTKNYDRIEIVEKTFVINTVDKSITIIGNKINDNTYMINKAGSGDIMCVHYKCENQSIITGIEYLYNMYKSLI